MTLELDQDMGPYLCQLFRLLVGARSDDLIPPTEWGRYISIMLLLYSWGFLVWGCKEVPSNTMTFGVELGATNTGPGTFSGEEPALFEEVLQQYALTSPGACAGAISAGRFCKRSATLG